MIDGWTRIEEAVLLGCLRVRHCKMLHNALTDEDWDGNECHELRKALERLGNLEVSQ